MLLYDFLVFVDNYQRLKDPKPNIEEEIKKWQEFRKKKNPWRDMDLSFDNLKKLYREIIGKEFNEKESQNSFINPNNRDKRINELAYRYSV